MATGARPEDLEPTPVLSIGARLGDSDAKSNDWKLAVMALGREVMAARRSAPESALKVNVVFFIDGKIWPVDFEQIRTGRFRKADGHLMVQVPLHGPCPADARSVLLEKLAAAVDLAEAYGQKRGLVQHLDGTQQLVRQLR